MGWYLLCICGGMAVGFVLFSLMFAASCADCRAATRYREDLLSQYVKPGCAPPPEGGL